MARISGILYTRTNPGDPQNEVSLGSLTPGAIVDVLRALVCSGEFEDLAFRTGSRDVRADLCGDGELRGRGLPGLPPYLSPGF